MCKHRNDAGKQFWVFLDETWHMIGRSAKINLGCHINKHKWTVAAPVIVFSCHRQTSSLQRLFLITCRSYIQYPPSSWLDDYFDWVAPHGCCRHYSDSDKFCPSNGNFLFTFAYISVYSMLRSLGKMMLHQHNTCRRFIKSHGTCDVVWYFIFLAFTFGTVLQRMQCLHHGYV